MRWRDVRKGDVLRYTAEGELYLALDDARVAETLACFRLMNLDDGKVYLERYRADDLIPAPHIDVIRVDRAAEGA